jgi:TatD family-associated radical SAM protein
MSDTLIYRIGDAIYINLTNKCTNNCTFCLRETRDGVDGYHLRLQKDPEASEIIDALEKETDVSEAVFCGLGEPTMRLEALLEVARYLKDRGSHVRLNTNGQGSAYAGHDIAPELKGLVDTVSISLNASDAVKYDAICKSIYGEEGFDHMMDFARSCIAQGIETILSVVDLIGKDEIAKCEKIAKDTGAKLRIRHYIE